MKLIIISQGRIVKVDDADYDVVSQYTWSAVTFKNCKTVYAKAIVNRRRVLLHRFIMGVLDAAVIVDHKDGNGLNCQRDNLRLATRSQNGANRRNSEGKKYIGVAKGKSKYSTYWRATCTKDGITYTKYATTIEQAALFYNELAIKHHGEFARINTV